MTKQLSSCFIGFLLASLVGTVSAQGRGISLAGGLVTTRTDVQKYADLAQDLAELQRYVANGDADEFLSLFRNGRHAQHDNGDPFPLAALGDDLEDSKTKTPAFLYHLHGITNRNTNFPFVLAEQQQYINKFVEATVQENLNYAVDSILTVGVWMYATHLLFDGVHRCRIQTEADNPSQLEPLGGAGFDEFIALYIGEGQDVGADTGDSLYRWAQVMGDFFGTADPEASVNTNIVLLYKKAKDALSVQGACTNAVPGTVTELWKIATMIVSQMSIPLFQGLIYSVLEDDADGAKVYAKALVPQTSKCRPSTYKRLKQNLIDEGVDLSAAGPILQDLQDAYACFGYTCREVGNYNDDPRLECDEDKYNPTLAGYDPLTDVSAVARVDLDVLQIRILASLQASDFALLQYLHGTNVFKFGSISTDVEFVSMHDIAVSTERSNAPSYNAFVEYHDERDYADKIVQDALRGRSKWLATEQIAATASLACAYMITFMEAISKLRIGVSDCRESDGDGLSYTLDPVDEAAALIVGSMGGSEEGGAIDREDGQLMYSLANNVGFQFGTLNQQEYAIVNEDIINLLFAARAEIDVLDCDSLETSVDLLEKYLTVGIIQAAILAAIRNENLPSISTATSIAEGESLSMAVLPYFFKQVPDSAQIIGNNMIWRSGTRPVVAGASAVAHNFGRGLAYGVGLRCSFLGSTEGVNPCSSVSSDVGTVGIAIKPSAAPSTRSYLLALVLAVTASAGLLIGL